MIVPAITLAELTRQAIEVLSRELGAAEAIRFINQFTTGFGDYTEERPALIGTMSLDQIIAEIKGLDADGDPPRFDVSDPAV